MNKKAQGQIITTILIILLVLAAIVIVWQVVGKTVTEGGEEIESQASCIGTSITINSADVNGKKILITRNAGGYEGDITFKLIVNGMVVDATTGGDASLGQLESATITYEALALGDEIEVAPVVDEQACTPNNKFDNVVDTTA